VALNAYLRLVGQKSGEIKGSVTQKGREGRIMVIAASHDVASPRDPATGMATGKRQHTPFLITKELDKSTPLLHQAQAANESFREWELQFWTPQTKASSGAGTEVQHFTVTLTNASIASMRTLMQNNKNPELMKYDIWEEIAFVYEQITWTWKAGPITASDDWSQRLD